MPVKYSPDEHRAAILKAWKPWKSTKEIAKECRISPQLVRYHMAQIRKLDPEESPDPDCPRAAAIVAAAQAAYSASNVKIDPKPQVRLGATGEGGWVSAWVFVGEETNAAD